MKRCILLLTAVLSSVIATTAHAQLWVYCGNLPGCSPGFSEYFSGALALLYTALHVYAYPLAVLFILIGGAYMLLSSGNAELVTKGRNTIIWALVGLFIAQNADVIVLTMIKPEAQDAAAAGSDVIQGTLLTAVTTVMDLFYIALVGVAVYCGMRMVLSMGKEEEFNKFRDGLFWAVGGAVVINLAFDIASAIVTL